MFTLGFSNLTTFLGVNTAPFVKTVTYPSTTQGRVLRVKDISGTTATAGSLMLSTTQGALFDGKASTLLFSTNTNTFTSITAVADGASNWVIKSAYTDMLIRAPPQPTDVSGLQLWFDANTVRGLTGQQIHWFGNRLSTINAGRKSNEVFVATAANVGPLLQVSSLNGNNTLLFNNTTYNMRLSTVRTYDTMTFFAVSRLTNVTNARIWQGTQADIRYGYSSGRKNLLYMDNWVTDTATNSNITTVNSNWDLLTVNRDVQGNAELFNYGISRGRGFGYMGFQGLGINNGFANEPSTAEIAEWILYNKKLSLGEQQRVEGYLAQKYGFTSQLPLTHPFTTQLASTLGAPSTISDIPNLRLWFDVTQLGASNGQKISSLSNLVRTGEVFGSNSATSTTWATFSTNQLNGYPILDFANTQILFLQQPRKYPVFTMFAMTRMTPGGATARYLLQGTTWSTWYGYGNNIFGTWVKNYYVTDNNIEIRGTANTFTWDLYTFSRNPSGIARFAIYGSNINRGFSQIGFEGLAINTGWDAGNTSACQFAEVLVYDRELNSEECSRVESYLAYKYNEASNLYIPQPAVQNLFLQTPQPIISTISSISSITNLKFWYDATQIPVLTPHRYVSLKQTTILPSNVSSLDCWYDASGASNFLTSFSSIVLWYDKGSNARHLAQATQSNQPSWDSNLNRVWFNGATQFLVFPTIPNVISNAAFTIFMVEQRQAGTSWIFGGSNTGTNCNLYAGYNAAATYYVGFTGNDFSIYLDTTYTNNFTNQYEPYRIWTIQYGGLNRRFYINGTQILRQAGISALTSWLGAALGRYTTNYYTGYMREFIVYSNAINDRDRENIEGYLATKWGLQSNLTTYTPVSTMFNLTRIGANIIASNTGDHYWMPKLNYSSINGFNTLHFNSNNSMFQAQTIIYPTEFTMFTMARHSFFGAGVGCNSRSIFQGLTTGNTAYGYGQNVFGTWVKNYFTNDGNVETAGAPVDSNWNLHRFQRNSNGIGSLAVWGSNMNRGYIQSGFEGLGIHFGTTFANSNFFSDCDIAEIIIYDRALDPKEAKDVEYYLANKYALTSNLYIPVLATSNQFEVTPQPLLSTISTLSSITNLKFWYDTTQIPVITQHPYMGIKQTTILPSNVSSLDCWFDVSGVNNFSTFGSSIAIWYDKGSNGRNLVQSTLSNEPTYDSVNNRLRFNGNTQFLLFTTIPNINTNVAFTVFMVEQRQTAITYAFGGSNTNTNTNLYAGYNTAINYTVGFFSNDFSMYTDSTFSNRNISDEPYRIWSIRYNSLSNRSFYINGSLILSQNNIAPLTSWLGAALGRYTTNYYNGFMREFIVYSNAINDNDRQRIEGYLATKWGLQSNLTNYTPVSTIFNLTQLGANMIASNSGDAYWMPKLNYSSINGMNVLRFNTSNSMFQSNVFIYPSEFTMFTLSRYIFANGFSNSRSIFQGLRSGATAYGYGTNVFGTWVKNYFTSDGNVEINGTAVDGNWNLHRFQRNSVGIGSLAVWGSNMNKGYIQTGFEGIAINYGVTFGNTVYSDCDIAEIIIYDRFLTSAETIQVESYIANKYALTSNLYVPLLATSNQFVSTPQPIVSTVSTLSDITNLKYWFDPSQISILTHPYKTSTASANISSIASISSLDCWFDASGVKNFSTVGSTISAWYDMGPNRRHLFQTTQVNMPFYVSSQNLVRFNAGLSHFLNFTTTPNIINNDYTVFVVEQRQTDTGYFIGGCNGATNQQFWMGYSNLVSAGNNWNYAVQAHMNNDLYSTVDFISVRLSQEPYRIWSAQYGSNTGIRRTFINGLIYAYQNFRTDLQTWSNAYVGRNSIGFYTGNMREIIFYNRFLTDEERTQVEGYLAAKWNLVSSLTSQTPISTLTNLTRLGSDLVIPFGNTCNMPLLVTNPTLGNKNVLRFDTNRYMFQTTVRIYPTEYTMFTLSRHIASSNGGLVPGLFSNRSYLSNSRTIFQGLFTNALYGYGSGSNGFAKNYFINDGNVETFGVPVDSNWNLHRFQRQADSMTSLWYFGSNVNRGYTQSGFEGLGINYGANSTSNNANSDCEVGEILIYDRNLTSAECTRVEQYLANKYGLSTTYVQMSTPNYASSIVVNISSLSSLTGLKLWFDPSQMTYLQHPYSFSTVGSNFSPSSISSLETWYDASVSTSISSFGSTIAFWQDIGFYGRHLYQSTVINQPRYISSAIKESNSVFFDGNSRFLNMSTVAGIASNDFTIFIVEQRQTGNANNYILGGSNTSNFQNLYIGYSGASNAYVDIYANSLTGIVENYADYGNRCNIEPNRIWSVHYSLASNYRYMYINGQLLASNALVQDMIGWLNPTIGRAWPGGGPYFYRGFIKEIQFYTTAFDVPTRQLMEGYLATKWNIQGNLLSNTPISTLKNMTNNPVDMLNNTGQLFNMPFLSSSALLGGKNVMRFDVNKRLFLGYYNSNAVGLPTISPLQFVLYPMEFTLFYIARHIGSNANNNRIILQGQNVASYFGYTTNKKNYFFLDGNIEINGTTTNSNWDMYTFVKKRDGMASIAYFGSNINTAYTQSGFEGMAINTGNDAGNVSDCEVGEILLYDTAFGPTDTAKVERYLANKYNMTSNLLQQFSNVPQPLLTNVISSLSTIPDIKFWYDATQIPILRHPYNFSSPRVNPSTFPGLDCWFDASGTSNFSTFGSSIGIWFDKGSNSRHLIQRVSSNLPTLVSSQNRVFLNGSQFMYFSTAPTVVRSDFTIFVLEQRQTTGNGATTLSCFLGGSNSNNNQTSNFFVGYSNFGINYSNIIIPYFTSATLGFYNNDLNHYIPPTTRFDLEPYRIWSIQYSSNLRVRRFFINGLLNSVQSNFTSDIQEWNFPSLGLLNSNNGSLFYYTGNMREMIFYNNFMGDSQREEMEGYLAWKWGLQSNLMSNTPISTIKNLAGTGCDLIPTVGNLCNYPSLIFNSTLGRQVLRFNSNTPMFQSNAFFYHSDYTFFVLSRQLVGGQGTGGPSNTGGNCNIRSLIFGLNTGIFGYGNGYNGYAKNIFNADGTVENYGTPPDSNWDLFRFRRESSGQGSLHYFGSNINKGYLQSGFEGFGINYSYSYFWYLSGNNLQASDGEIAEIIFYNRALSSNECSRVENYITNKYNLAQRMIEISTPTLLSTISTLSSISNLKLWFDPSQMNILQHAYRFSTVGSNFSPSSISSLDAWYDASLSTNFTFASGSNVSQWRDSTGRGRTLVQATTSNQPFYMSTVNSISSAVYFNNSNFMAISSIANITSNDYTIFVVEQRQSNSATNYFMGTSSSNTTTFGNLFMGYNATNSVYTDITGNGLSATIDPFSNTPFFEPNRIWSVHYSSNLALRSLYINGHLLNSNFMFQDLLSWRNASIGSFNNGTAYFYTGYIKEILFFSNALDTGTRQLVEGYLATKWNLQSNLMSNTPISTLKNLTGLCTDMINTTGQLYTMPILVRSEALGGRNVMRFDALRNQPLFLGFLNSNTSNLRTVFPTNSLIYPNEYSLFYIARHINSNTTNSRLILQGQTQTAYYGYNTAQKKNMFFNDGWIEINGNAANSNWDLFSFTRNSEGIAANFYFGSNINIGYATSGFEGMAINTPDTTNVSDCEVGEMLVYDRCLGTEERNQVETYLANKYNMTSNLLQINSNVPQALLTNVISSLSTIPDIKFWYDATQIPILRHPYNFSSPRVNPSTFPGLDCWFDASGVSNFSTFNSSIRIWYDKGSNSRHLIQTVNSNLPILVSSQNTVLLDGSRFMYFSTAPTVVRSDFTIFVLEQRQTNGNGATTLSCFLGGSNSNAPAGNNQNSNFFVGYSNFGINYSNIIIPYFTSATLGFYNNDLNHYIPPTTRFDLEPYRIWSIQYSSNLRVRRFFINGLLNSVQSNFATNVEQWSFPSLGLLNSNNGSLFYYTGNMREMIFYNNFMGDSQREEMEGYLAWKWGLQSNLMSNTPISTIRNLAGTGCDLIPTAGNLCNYPSLIFNPTLGRQVLRFNSNTPMFQSNAFFYHSDYTFFVLARQLAGPGATVGPSNTGGNCNIRSLIFGLNTGMFGYGNGYNGYAKNIFNADGTVENYGTPPDSNWDLFRFRRESSGQGSLHYFGSNINKGYLQSGFEGFGINYSFSYFWYLSGSVLQASDGEVAEIIFYNRALSSNECSRVENYIANKYNLSQRMLQISTPVILNTISSLSSISSLKLWFDPSQMNILQHAYSFSTVGSNFSPSSISSLDAWYDASISTNFTFASGSNVSQWRDSTGRGRTLTQATASNQPFYMSTVNSISTALYFNNSQFLSFTTLPNITSNDYTIFVVEQRQSNSATNYFMGSGSANTTSFGNLYMGYNATNSVYTDIYANGLGATIETFITQPSRFTEPNRIWSVQYSSNLRMRSLFINGQLLNSNFMFQDLTSWRSASIGSFNNGTAYFYTGYIKEILFFSNALDTGTRQLVEGYLATKWNLQANLMSNTPISTLKNLTGMPIDMINTTGQLFNMPTLSSSALLGGRNVMRFNALRNQPLFLGFLNSNTSNLPTVFPTYPLIYPNEYSLFYIARHLGCNTTYSRLILQGQTQTAYYGYNTAQKKNMFFNDGWIEINGNAANSNWDLFSFTRNSEGIAANFYFGSNINIGYATSGFEGMAINTPDTTNVSDCEVGEILVYDRCLGQVERNRVETYLANKYNMTSNLLTQSINYPLTVNAAPAAGPSTLSTITNLKFWFDPGQLPLLEHPYKTSSIIGISPSTISNLDCWFDASGANNFTLSVSNVTRWIDKTGRGRDLIQATIGNQPIFSTNTREVVFTGSGSQFMTFSNIPAITNSDYTIFVLEKRQSNTVPNYFIGGSNTGSFTQLYMGYNTTSNFFFDHYNNGTQLTIDNYTSVPLEPYRLWTMAYSSNLNTREMYLNGVRYITIATSNDLLSWIGASVGRFWNGTTYYYTGTMREIIMYNRYLPSSERTVVEGYLAKKWNLQSNLTTFTPVSTLRNLTGIASDFTAQFANPCQLSNMPTLNYNTGIGYNTLLFTATTPIRTMQLCNNLLFPNEYTLFTVSRHTPGINKTIFQSITAPNTLYGYGFNPSNSTWVKNYFCNDGAVEVFGNPSNTLWDVNTFHRDSNGIATLFYFGSNFNRGYTQSGFEGLSINYGSYDSGCNSASECEVSEILIYDRALPPAEQKSVERYLTNKYGMSTIYNFYTNANPYTTVSTISSISTLQVWLDASQIVASNNASISTVANFTNLGGLFLNNVDSNYPTLLTNYQNGNNTLNFTTTQKLFLAPSRIWQNFSMFSMTRHIGGINKRIIQGTTGDVAYGNEGGFKNRHYMEQWQHQSMIASDTNWDINNLIRTSNGFLSTVTWNGSTIVMSNPSTFLGLEGIGFNYCNTGAASDFQLGELLVYNRPLLFPTEVQAVEGYLARKWATQRFLPVSHPGFLYQLTAFSGYTVQASTMSTLCLWLDSAFTSTITTNQTGTSLVRWSDRMGKIASISQATTLYQPNYTVALGPNFANSNYLDIGQLSSLVVASTFSMLFLERRQSTNTCNMILGGADATTNNNLQVGYYNTSSFAFSFYNNETTVQVSSFSNTQIEPPRIWSMTYDRQRKFLFMNGGVVSSVQTTTQDLISYTAPTIGSNAATGTAYNGYLMEALVYSPALSTPALRLAEGYLAWKWGINSFLAPSHPWYNTQPVLPGGITHLPGLWAKFYTQTGGPSVNGPDGGGWGTPIVGTFTAAPGATLNSNTPGPTSVIWYGNNNGYYPAGNQCYSAVYTGFIYSASGGTIQFQFNTDDGMVVFFNGVNVLSSWTPQGDTQYTSGSITLPAGYTPIVSRWYDSGGGGQSILRTNINGGGFTENGAGRYFYLASNITQT